jgi:hypothetical protein
MHLASAGYALTYMDEFIDDLLTQERVCDVILPRLTKREVLEDTEGLKKRKSTLVSLRGYNLLSPTLTSLSGNGDERRRRPRLNVSPTAKTGPLDIAVSWIPKSLPLPLTRSIPKSLSFPFTRSSAQQKQFAGGVSRPLAFAHTLGCICF